jgi:PadR family transcriptional regulator PadR
VKLFEAKGCFGGIFPVRGGGLNGDFGVGPGCEAGEFHVLRGHARGGRVVRDCDGGPRGVSPHGLPRVSPGAIFASPLRGWGGGRLGGGGIPGPPMPGDRSASSGQAPGHPRLVVELASREPGHPPNICYSTSLDRLCRVTSMLRRAPRLTKPSLALLSAFLGSQPLQLSGADIARVTRLKSGTMYPILARLENAGYLASKWEEGDPSILGRPRRRYYRMTPEGEAAFRTAVAEIREYAGSAAWANL